MNTARRMDSKEEITADVADAKGIERALCRSCGQVVKLHRGKKIAHHFEHLPSRVPCPERYHKSQRP